MSTPIMGTGYGLFIDTVTALTEERGTEANYKLVACGVTNGLDINAAEQTTSNKCDGGFASSLSGLIDWSFSFDGQAVTLLTGEATSKVNYQALLTLMINKQVFFAKLENPDDPTYIREGKVRISTISESQPNQDVFTVTATFVGVGELFIVPEA